MNVLHRASSDDIEAVVGSKNSHRIIAARSGNININAGGGGVYGKVELS